MRKPTANDSDGPRRSFQGRDEGPRPLSSLAALSCLFILAGTLAFGQLHPGAPSATSGVLHPGQKSAAIVDQLQLDSPNPFFRAQATRMLETAGYVVDYYPSANVTVSFYQKLPSYGYQLILLRNHATATSETHENESVFLFTSQKLRNRASLDGMPEGVRLGRYSDNLMVAYSIIGDRFVRQSMQGHFNGALIINMGCEGAKNDSLAKAFLERGASAYVGWDEQVTAGQTDKATLTVLEAYLENQTIGDAVQHATQESPEFTLPHSPRMLWATANRLGDEEMTAPSEIEETTMEWNA